MKDFVECQQVFAYGTLMRSGSNAWRMDGASFIGEVSVSGELYKIDWYPGVVLSKSASEVFGEIYKLKSAFQLSDLDAYEGSEYRRVLHETELGKVWIWEYQEDTTQLKIITTGRWL